MQQYSQQRPGYGSNSKLSDDGSYSDAQDSYAPSYHQNGKAPDFQPKTPPMQLQVEWMVPQVHRMPTDVSVNNATASDAGQRDQRTISGRLSETKTSQELGSNL
jgi:hypothetical protein